MSSRPLLPLLLQSLFGQLFRRSFHSSTGNIRSACGTMCRQYARPTLLVSLCVCAMLAIGMGIGSAHAAPAGLPSSATSATTPAASEAAASEVAAAPLLQSIDQVISTLENDTQRTALLLELHRLRDGVTPLAASEAAAAEKERRGLIGVLSNAIEQADTQLRREQIPLRYWHERFVRAGEQLPAILRPAGSTSAWPAIREFLGVVTLWLLPAIGLAVLGRALALRRGISLRLGADPSTRAVLLYAARMLGPWAIGLVVTVLYTRAVGRSPPSVLAMLLASAVLAGVFFYLASTVLFSVLATGHRRAAADILKQRTRIPLAIVGALVVLGDGTGDSRVVAALGFSVATLASTGANIAAALLIAWMSVRYRRAIGHLIVNRPAEYRLSHRTSYDTVQLVARYWYLPILAIVLTSVVATLVATGNAEIFLQRTVSSVALFILAMLASSLVGRAARLPHHAGIRRRRSPYVARFLRFLRAVVRLVVWLIFLELCARVWDTSLVRLMGETVYGREIGTALTSIIATVFLAWLVWLIMDTAITEALTSHSSRGRAPSVRARTILPLVRNAAFITIVVIAAIVTLANLGVNVTPLLAGAGVIGLAIGFGAQTLVQDLITGLFIIIEDSIAVGDSIDVGSHAGTVEALTIRTVRLRDLSGATHVIPFSAIKTIKNMSRGYGYAVFNVSVAYDTNIDQAIDAIRQVGAQMQADYRYQLAILEPIEVLGLDRFEASGIVILARLKTQASATFTITRAFNLLLKQRFDESGIEMPFPQMTVHQAAQKTASQETPQHSASTSVPASPIANGLP
ncbi:mechanosensitive ion channel [Imbroritus primus]|uniref:Mechanosensitive ion channel n=1 Tax=Imbroritus primus TaxID=3058603 RepID=A0ACD3SVU0_9BURK|nr:mechanosensitive ion channel [Burkholderiaceae bacterium PBA]